MHKVKKFKRVEDAMVFKTSSCVLVLNCWLAAGITRHLSYNFLALQDTVWTLMTYPIQFTLILCLSIAIIGKQCAKKKKKKIDFPVFSLRMRLFCLMCWQRATNKCAATARAKIVTTNIAGWKNGKNAGWDKVRWVWDSMQNSRPTEILLPADFQRCHSLTFSLQKQLLFLL